MMFIIEQRYRGLASYTNTYLARIQRFMRVYSKDVRKDESIPPGFDEQ